MELFNMYLMYLFFFFLYICSIIIIFTIYFERLEYLFSNEKIKFITDDNTLHYIYRIEKNNIGPYQNQELLKNTKHFKNKKVNKNNNPTVYHEDKNLYLYLKYIKIFKLYIFGFNNQRDIYNWFEKEDLKILRNNNFQCNVYISKNYFKLNKQVLFSKEKSLKIKTIPF